MESGSTTEDDARRETERSPRECPPAEADRGSRRAEPAEHDDRMGEEPGYGYGV